jgi:hypothetical protein
MQRFRISGARNFRTFLTDTLAIQGPEQNLRVIGQGMPRAILKIG